MSDKRILNITFAKNGKGFLSPRINLPLKILNLMGINENNKTVELIYENNEIIIRKEENK